MHGDYWARQSSDEPLFPDLLWSRPENKRQAGKLLVIGGNSFGFSAVGEAYATAERVGIGNSRVLLPEALRKTAGLALDTAEFAASNPSGSFSKQALGEWLEQAAWADGILLAGDVGHNSETTILLESFLAKHKGQVTLTGDTLDLVLPTPNVVLERPNTLLVLSMGQLQKLAMAAHFDTAFRLGMELLQLVEALHSFTTKYPVAIITKHHSQLVVAVAGKVSSTKLETDLPVWRVKTATSASVWWLQNPTNSFEALTTAVFPGSPS